MNTQEIEKLYIEHADDFRELLGTTVASAMAIFDKRVLVYNHCGWFAKAEDEFTNPMPVSLAVAAMTEAWRERLEKEHNIQFEPIGREVTNDYRRPPIDRRSTWILEGWQITVLGDSPKYLSNSTWCDFGGKPVRYDKLYKTLPEAICAAVKALADEKRKAKAKAERLSAAKTMMGLDPATGPDFTATITYAPISEDRIRQIAREEIAKATGQKAAGK